MRFLMRFRLLEGEAAPCIFPSFNFSISPSANWANKTSFLVIIWHSSIRLQFHTNAQTDWRSVEFSTLTCLGHCPPLPCLLLFTVLALHHPMESSAGASRLDATALGCCHGDYTSTIVADTSSHRILEKWLLQLCPSHSPINYNESYFIDFSYLPLEILL